MALIQMQIGKKGLTSEFIETLRKAFVNSDSARVSLLKSATRDRVEVKKWAEKITSDLGKNFTYKTIGYTIVVRKWRKARTS